MPVLPNALHVLIMRELNEHGRPSTIIVVGRDVAALKQYALEFQAEIERLDEPDAIALEVGMQWELSEHSDLEFWWYVNPDLRYEIQPVDELV